MVVIGLLCWVFNCLGLWWFVNSVLVVTGVVHIVVLSCVLLLLIVGVFLIEVVLDFCVSLLVLCLGSLVFVGLKLLFAFTAAFGLVLMVCGWFDLFV